MTRKPLEGKARRKDSEEFTKPSCKICFEDNNCDDNRLLSGICPCKGSSTFIHHDCLIKCFESSGNQSCPCCKYDIKTTTKWKPWRKWSWEPMTDVELAPLVSVIILIWCVIFGPLFVSYSHYTYENIEQYSLFEIYMGCHVVIQCCGVLLLVLVNCFLQYTLDTNMLHKCGIIPHCRKFCKRNQERGEILPYEDNNE